MYIRFTIPQFLWLGQFLECFVRNKKGTLQAWFGGKGLD